MGNGDHTHTEIIEMNVKLNLLSEKVAYHDRLLVTGSDDTLSLPETVRILATTVNTYITRKEKEEENKKAEWGKWKWAVLGVVIPVALAFIGQIIWFYANFIPVAFSTLGQ